MLRHLPNVLRSRAGSLLVPAIIAFGLVAGFAREIILASLFGTSREIEIFRVASGLPAMLSETVAISFISVLIPVLLARSRNRGLSEAVWAVILLGVVITVVGIVTMPLQARLLAPGIVGENRETLIEAGWICWGMFLALFLTIPLRAAMSVRDRIWPGAAVASLRTVGFIVVLLAILWASGRIDAMTASWATLAAAVFTLLFQVAVFGRGEVRRIPRALKTVPEYRRIRPIVAAAGAVFVVQIIVTSSRFLDRGVSSVFEEGVLAAVEYSYAIVMAAAQIIGTSTNLVLAPKIGRALDRGEGLTRPLLRQIGIVVGVASAAGVILALGAPLVIALLFERGAFDAQSTALTASVFRWQALGIGPLVLALVTTQIAILMGLQGRLARVAMVKLAVKAASLFALVQVMPVTAAIGISFGLAEIAMALVTIRMIRAAPVTRLRDTSAKAR